MDIRSRAVPLPRLALAGPRPERGLLVLGDQRMRELVDATAWRRHRSVIGYVDPRNPEVTARDDWDEIVLDARLLDLVRTTHSDLLSRARRIWVVPLSATAEPDPSHLFLDPLPPLGRAVKRALDVALALVGLLLALPLLIVAAAAVRAETPGPAIFRQVRVGANGRRFRLYKLRTMHHGNDNAAHLAYVARLMDGTAERCGELFKLADDPRITTVGRFLRHFSIDELPQLWNVLKGDMSLVGPRPPLPAEIRIYSARAWERLRVKPGLTGLWQVSGRAALPFDEMVSLDLHYWQQWSLRADAAILLRTPRTVLTGRGAA